MVYLTKLYEIIKFFYILASLFKILLLNTYKLHVFFSVIFIKIRGD